MGIDGGDHSLSRKRGVGFGGHVCRAGFLCETARGDFRFRDSTENRARQSRAPLRALARARTPAELPVALDVSPSITAVYLPRWHDWLDRVSLSHADCPSGFLLSKRISTHPS